MKLKKTVLFATLFVTYFSLNAQTITSNWFHKPGDQYSLLRTTSPSITPPSLGLSQTWDYSRFTGGSLVTFSWVSPSVMSTASDFPNATIARYGSAGSGPAAAGSDEIFYKVSNDTVYALGSNVPSPSGGVDIRFRTIPNQTIIFPLNYGAQDVQQVDTIYVINSILNDTTYQTGGTFVTTFAGIGDIITPNDTFKNCVLLVDSIGGTTEPYAYRWYKNSFSNKIAEYTFGNDPTTGPFEYLYLRDTSALIANGSVNLNEQRKNKSDLSFKGKVDNELRLSSESNFNANCQLISSDGKLVDSWNKQFTVGDNSVEINNNIPKAGMYILFVYNNDTGQFNTFKFICQ
jgi:hypothetical protein